MCHDIGGQNETRLMFRAVWKRQETLRVQIRGTHVTFKHGLTVPGVSGDGVVSAGHFVVIQKRLPCPFRINRPWLMRSRGSTTARPEILEAPRYHGSARTVHIPSVAHSLESHYIFFSRLTLPIDCYSRI